MTQWTAFVGATGLVLTGFLVLARLSQHVGDDLGRPQPQRRPGDRRRDDQQNRDGSQYQSTDPRNRDPNSDRSPDSGEQSWSGTRAPDTEGSLVTDAPTERPVGPSRADIAGPAASISPGALLANVALTQGLFGGLLAAAAWYFAVPGEALGLWGGSVEGASAVAVGAVAGVALWVGNELAAALADAAGATYDEGLRKLLAPDDARGWALLLGVTLPVIAVVEEFLFRGAAIGATSAAFGGAWALAVVSSAAFALGHGAQGRVGVAVTGALGFALAATYLLTGSLLVVVVAHYLVNALEFGLHEGLGLPDPVWS